MYKDGTKSGGKRKGSKNKSTLARLAAIEEASKKIANIDGSGIFEGDAQAFLTLLYKTESFPLDVRMRAAEMANTRERPALQAVDSTITDQRVYVVEMPAPVKDLDEWRALHCKDQSAPDAECGLERTPRADRHERSAAIKQNRAPWPRALLGEMRLPRTVCGMYAGCAGIYARLTEQDFHMSKPRECTLIPVHATDRCAGHLRRTHRGFVAYDCNDKPIGIFANTNDGGRSYGFIRSDAIGRL